MGVRFKAVLVVGVAAIVVTGAATTVAVARPSASSASAQKSIVMLKDGVSAQQNAHAHGVSPTKTFADAADGYAADLTPAAAQQVASDPDVLFVAPDRPVSALRKFHPTHVRATDSASDDGPYPPVTAYRQTVPTDLRRVGLGQGLTAADVQGRGRSVDVGVAILDTGVQVDNPDLDVVGGTNCSDDPTPGYGDVEGHGTEVAGILAAKDNSFGVVGAAPGARIYSVRTLDADGSAEDSNVVCALDWVAAHRNLVKVGNMSFGGPEFPDDHDCGLKVHDPVHLAVCRVVAGGTTLVAGAGNDAQDITAEQFDPANYTQVITASGYADTDGKPGGRGGETCQDGFDEGGDDRFAPFSNYGQAADISAVATCNETTYDDGTLVSDAGTSFASPAVSGAVARLYAVNPSTRPSQAKAALQALADHHPIPGDPRKPNEGLLNISLLGVPPSLRDLGALGHGSPAIPGPHPLISGLTG